MTRIVVTGLGLVTSIGIGRDAFWDALLAGKHGIAPVQSFDTTPYRIKVGGEIQGFAVEDHLVDVDPAWGRAAQFAVLAAKLALQDGGWEAHPRLRRGVAMGTTSGEPHMIERLNDAVLAEREQELGAELLNRYPCNHIPGFVASYLDFCDVVPVMLPAACAAGNYAIGHAADLLRNGVVDAMLAGASDSFSRITYTGFHRLGAIAPEICQPFDANRKGMIPGEGAAFLLLETESAARARDATIYAELAGYGLSCDAFHMTGGHPEGHGAVAAMEAALVDSGFSPDAVSYISAHGTGTPSNDRNEVRAVKRVFGEHTRTPISSIKSMLGHTMGAASAIEAVTCALAVARDQIPPTINLETPDPECDLDFVPDVARDHRVNLAMSNAYAFGGNNASILLKKYEG